MKIIVTKIRTNLDANLLLFLFCPFHTVPLTISYHLFQFLIGKYSVAEIRYFIKTEIKMIKTKTL